MESRHAHLLNLTSITANIFQKFPKLVIFPRVIRQPLKIYRIRKTKVILKSRDYNFEGVVQKFRIADENGFFFEMLSKNIENLKQNSKNKATVNFLAGKFRGSKVGRVSTAKMSEKITQLILNEVAEN